MASFVVEQCLKEGKPLPEKLANAPELLQGLELYWKAYEDLSTCRPAGFSGAYPVPWIEVARYATINDFDEEQAERLHFFVSRMDETFLKWFEKKHGSQLRKTNSDSGPWARKGCWESRPEGGSGRRPGVGPEDPGRYRPSPIELDCNHGDPR